MVVENYLHSRSKLQTSNSGGTYPEYRIDTKQIITYLRQPEIFCYLVSNAKKIDEVTSKSGYYSGDIAVFKTIAPIAYAYLVANKISHHLYIDENDPNKDELRSDYLLQSAYESIEANPSLLPAPNMLSVNSWKTWATRNQSTIDAFYMIPLNCDPTKINQFIGN